MKIESTENLDHSCLDKQHSHWENVFSKGCANLFGTDASVPAQKAVEMFKNEGKIKILELGGGFGRDTLFFAKEGFDVTVGDYSEQALESLRSGSKELGLSDSITPFCHDVRKPLPFEDGQFDACYSHMLMCMALTTSELEFAMQEIKRVLKKDGLNIYTVRNTTDPQYATGTHRGEDMYEIEGGFIVHFFSREKVDHLAQGYELVDVGTLEETALPRRLYMVTMRKP
ncbi:class I SAM-dependent methyltransferase [Methanolobus sp. ZRKC3]|uniref:class I SAM-dependent methyltransferase n=1 Tax=Methanolobus sp. ZRKC3 TaxID=3125786 RepID=UPI003248E842